MLKACIDCGLPTEETRCPKHQRERRLAYERDRRARAHYQGLTGARGSTRQSRKRRDEVLAEARHICHYCGAPATAADHYIPLALNGPDTKANLVAACRDCNQAKGARPPQEFLDSAWLKRRREEIRQRSKLHIIALVGPPAVGKSWVRERVAERIDIPQLGIDECGPRGAREFRWDKMLGWLREQKGVALVECNVVPREFAERLRLHPSTVIEVIASEKVRRERLEARQGSWSHRTYPIRYPVDRRAGPERAVELVIGVAEAAQTAF